MQRGGEEKQMFSGSGCELICIAPLGIHVCPGDSSRLPPSQINAEFHSKTNGNEILLIKPLYLGKKY